MASPTKNGIKESCIGVNKSRYDNVIAKLRNGAKFSDFISCTRGWGVGGGGQARRHM